MDYRWQIAPSQDALCAVLAEALGISPLLARCLVNRGESDPESISRFLRPRLRNLSDPFELPDMCIAVERLIGAREKGQMLALYGDYDVDGVTSTALLKLALSGLGWRVSWYLPQRLDEGYGLSREGVDKCLESTGCSLLLAVDCGSTAVESVSWLQQRKVDVLVLDHHKVSDPAPPAFALINPKRQKVPPANGRELCSVGLAFKLAHALVKRGRQLDWNEAVDFDLRPLLDLVALGTVADLVPLQGENRILVSAGLERLSATRRPGLVELKSVAGTGDSVGVYEVGFQLAPRLNAAGRLEDASAALELLLARDDAEALRRAKELDSKNRERQRIERVIVEEVIGELKAKFNPAEDFAIVEGRLLWHIGVVGIVAARVVREFHRPAIIIGGEGSEWRGSGRSIEGFDLADALGACDDLLIRHGGHSMAAGLSIHPDNVDALRTRLNRLAKQSLKPELLKPALRIDAEIELAHFTTSAIEELEALRPFGQGNPAAQLVSRRVTLDKEPRPLGRDRKHLKLWVRDGTATFEAVWWNANGEPTPSGEFDLAFAPEINHFKGRRSVQLRILDWKPSGRRERDGNGL